MSGRPLPYKRLLELAEQSQGFKIPVPGVRGQSVEVLPDYRGRWAVKRNHLFGDEYLTAAGEWADTVGGVVEDVYSWRLALALQRADEAAVVMGAEHAAWKAKHDAEAKRAGDLAAVVDEFLEPIRAAVAESAVA
jgi:hypothetical protein